MPDDIVTRLHVIAWGANEGEEYADVCRLAADEIELLREARIHLRKLLDEFVELCTEEQHTAEMLCLHRAATKCDPWEYEQKYGRGSRRNKKAPDDCS